MHCGITACSLSSSGWLAGWLAGAAWFGANHSGKLSPIQGWLRIPHQSCIFISNCRGILTRRLMGQCIAVTKTKETTQQGASAVNVRDHESASGKGTELIRLFAREEVSVIASDVLLVYVLVPIFAATQLAQLVPLAEMGQILRIGDWLSRSRWCATDCPASSLHRDFLGGQLWNALNSMPSRNAEGTYTEVERREGILVDLYKVGKVRSRRFVHLARARQYSEPYFFYSSRTRAL
ncbi:hypothetical protein B0T17DRAFT_124076 [Bombardia bombarda]|uniref:Uncharacterized protein n=1 Tax=Bombardia bombarda TaxID=252184 RepID=A0AA39U0R0_9PEZI|nr:hypothetical protein B0T17DRAFT_124076 [Bombardia bombarda]